MSAAKRSHPFPSRTRPLSFSAPTILEGQPSGKIGRCRSSCGQFFYAFFSVFFFIICRDLPPVARGLAHSSIYFYTNKTPRGIHLATQSGMERLAVALEFHIWWILSLFTYERPAPCGVRLSYAELYVPLE